MTGLFGFTWMLGSVSPLQVLRGMLDMSLRWWHESPLLAVARALALVTVFWGLLNVVRNPGEGIVAAGLGMLGFYVLRRS